MYARPVSTASWDGSGRLSYTCTGNRGHHALASLQTRDICLCLVLHYTLTHINIESLARQVHGRCASSRPCSHYHSLLATVQGLQLLLLACLCLDAAASNVPGRSALPVVMTPASMTEISFAVQTSKQGEPLRSGLHTSWHEIITPDQ